MLKAQTVIAGTVIRDDQGRHLLVQESRPDIYGLWAFPGGHVDKGETRLQAAVRETFEETGFKVEITSEIPIHEASLTEPDHKYYAYKAEIIGGVLILNKNEQLDIKWFYPSEVEKLEAAGKMREPVTLVTIKKAGADELRP